MTGVPGRELHGRGAEMDAVRAAVAAAREGDGRAVVIEGVPGSGRTALVDAALGELCAGALVLRTTGNADEKVLAYAGLSDLCRPLHDALEELPDLQRSALQGAIALGPPAGDRLAVASAFLSLLRIASEASSLVAVAVDDAEHLDDGSSTALRYAARRLEGCPIVMLIAQDRDDESRLELTGRPHIELGPIDLDAAVDLVRALTPTTTTVAVADALVTASLALPGRLVRMVEATGTASGPSPPVDLDVAGHRAVQLNSPADEAAVLERFAELTSSADRGPALLQAGDAWLAAGRPAEAQRCGEEALREASGVELAEAKLLLARAELATGSGRAARAALREVADLAAAIGADALAARALLYSLPLHLHLGRAGEARAALEQATELLGSDSDSPELQLLLRSAELGVQLATGAVVEPAELLALIDAGPAAARGAEVPVIVTTVVMPLIWAERLPVARKILEGIITATRRAGALGELALPLAALATVERRSGRTTRALAAAAEAEQIAEEADDRVALMFARTELANVLAQRGDAERVRTLVGSLLTSDRPLQGSLEASARSALATVELLEGRWQAVVDVLEPLVSSDAGRLSALVTMYQQHLAVAQARLGRRADAERTIAELERAAQQQLSDRLPAAIERCRAMLAPPGEYDLHFEQARSLAGANVLSAGLTRHLHALRLVEDGRVTEAVTILSRLATSTDENTVGVSRAARRSLAQLGIALGSQAGGVDQLSDEQLRVVVASADGRPIDEIADDLRTTPSEVTRLRADAYRVLGVHTLADLQSALEPGPSTSPTRGEMCPVSETRVRLLGGLAVEQRGEVVPIPAGSVATTIALLALARTVHVEQLVEVLWPGTDPDVGRRRVRNVLARVRAAAGPILQRHGEQIILASDVCVDTRELEAALDVALDPVRGEAERDEARSRALGLYRGVLLPELPFAEWAAADRARFAMARSDLLRGLVERAVASGALDEALAVAEQALADAPDDEDLLLRAAELAWSAGRSSRARGLLRRARLRVDELGVPASRRLEEVERLIEARASIRP